MTRQDWRDPNDIGAMRCGTRSRRRWTAAVAVVSLWAIGCIAATAGSPPAGEPLRIGARPELFVVSGLIDRLTSATLVMHQPTPREVVFRFDAPWEGSDCGYVTVLRDGDEYRMYYRGGGEMTEEVTCLATSRDGIAWTRPTLGLFEFKGSKENNIVWKGRGKAYWESHNFTPFVDSNPAARTEERYKAVALAKYPVEDVPDRKTVLVSLVSPDGIHWKRHRDEPIIRKGGFDSQNLAFWDTVRGEYVCYSRMGREGVRSVQRSVSGDFIRWTEPEWLDFGPGTLEQFYTNAICAYERNPSIYIGLPMRFVPERQSVGDPPRQTDGLSDAVLIASRDGFHFERLFREAFIRPGLDPKNWGGAHGNNTPAWGILATSPEELSIYWTEHFTGEPVLRRGTLRVDGFVSVRGPYGGGEFVTRPVMLEGDDLVINYSTSAVGSVRVEVQDPAGRPLPGFELEKSGVIWGDELSRRVVWTGGAEAKSLKGKTVRLRVELRDTDLYSVRSE